MQKEGFIRGFKKMLVKGKKSTLVLLKYSSSQTPLIKRIQRVSKPGQRIFSKSQTLWKINNGQGVMIISTSQGFVIDQEARALNLGGEVICYIE